MSLNRRLVTIIGFVSSLFPLPFRAFGAGLEEFQVAAISSFLAGGTVGQTIEGERLSPSPPQPRDSFGLSVSKRGDTAIVGAPNDGCVEPDMTCGAAYIFHRDAGVWAGWVKLPAMGPPTHRVDGKFGESVAVDGDTALVGKAAEDCPDGVFCGAVYMWRLNGDVWEEQGKLPGPEPRCGDYFGNAISMDGDVAVVGSAGAYFFCPIIAGQNGAHVFRKIAGVWTFEEHLTAPAGSDNTFGDSVKVSGDQIIVGAYFTCPATSSCGSAYVYRWDGTSWLPDGALSPPEGILASYFGYAVSIWGDLAVVGAPAEDCEVGGRCGAAYVYRRSAGGWSLETILTPISPAPNEWFAQVVDVSGETIVVGAQQHDCSELENCGAAYLYAFNGTNWVYEGRLLSPIPVDGGLFAHSLSFDDGSIVIGALSELGVPQCPSTCGSAFVFDPIPVDCNMNGVSDAQDLAGASSNDCNANLRPDECDVPPFDPQGIDCNANSVPDGCDLSAGSSIDANGNSIPDECDPPNLNWISDGDSATRSSRSMSLTANPISSGGMAAALQVKLLDLHTPNPANPPCCPPPNFGAYESATCTAVGEDNGCARWVGPPVTIREAQDNVALGTFVAARLQCTPYYTDWSTLGSFVIVGPEIMPSSTFELTAYGSSCKGAEAGCTNVSSPVTVLTRRSGDVSAPYAPTGTQPDPQDVVAVLNKFRNQPGAPGKAVAQIQPNVIELNNDVGALDIVATIDAFRGTAYPFSGPCPCPSTVTCNATACGPPACASGGLCVRTCIGGAAAGQPCLNDSHCPAGTCGAGFCRDRCGRCRD